MICYAELRELYSATAKERDEANKRIEELESELDEKNLALEVLEEIHAQEKRKYKGMYAIVKADRDRLQIAYDAMARDLKFMSDELARRARNG